ncbi:MAG: zinc-ribbon domain-containing protein [Liquorilactobacillus mali]|uniref:DUF805 domain-containing protein n=1 Tax=Liquorilactobacillus mali TaxID=1618 RepID=UPI0039EC9AEE
MKCQSCGYSIEENEHYCNHCGTKQAIFEDGFEAKKCKFCKKDIPVNANYCVYCGKDQAFIDVKSFSEKAAAEKVRPNSDETKEKKLSLNESEKPGIFVSTKLMIKDMFVLQKRMGRADFWWSIAGIFALSLVFGLVLGEVLVIVNEINPAVVDLTERIAISLWMTLIYISITTAQIRRLHDCSLPGILILMKFLFGFGDFLLLLLLILPQSKRDMSYTFNKKQ